MAAFLLLLGSAAQPDRERADEAYRQFAQAAAGVRFHLHQTYGTVIKTSSPAPEIETEIDWLGTEEDELLRRKADLDSGADELWARDFHIRSEQETLDAKQAALAHDRTQLDVDSRMLDVDLANCEADRIKHDQKPHAFAKEQQAEADAYNREANEGNARSDGLIRRKAELLRQKQALDDRTDEIRWKNAELHRRRSELNADEAAHCLRLRGYTAECEAALTRARALDEIVGVRSSYASDRRADTSSNILTSMGTDGLEATGKAILEAISAKRAPAVALELAGVSLEGVGAVITAEDITSTAMDERSREIEANILLLGDYALAIKRLQANGRLNPSDQSYQALKKMIDIRRGEMPGTSTEFAVESIATLRTLGATLVSVASKYGSKKIERVGPAIMNRLSPMEKKALGTGAYRFFSSAISGTVSLTTDEISQDAGRRGLDLLMKQRSNAEQPTP